MSLDNYQLLGRSGVRVSPLSLIEQSLSQLRMDRIDDQTSSIASTG